MKMSNVVVLATNKQTLKINRNTNSSSINNSVTNFHQSSNDSSKQTSILPQQQQHQQGDQYNNDTNNKNSNNSNCNSNLETNRSHSCRGNTVPESSYSSLTSSLALSSSSSQQRQQSSSPPSASSSSSSSSSLSSSSSSTSSSHLSSSSSSFSSFRERTKTSLSTASSSSSTASIVFRQTNKLQSKSQQHCSCMLLNKNINPALEGASSGSSGPSTTTDHNCQCSINHQQQQQAQQPYQHQHQKQHHQHRSIASLSYYDATQADHPNEKYIKLVNHTEASLKHSNPNLVKNTLCISNNNTSTHYKALKRSHRSLQLEQQQPQLQTAPINTSNYLACQELHEGYQPQRFTNSLQLLDLPLPAARNLLRRKNISEQDSGEEGNVTTVGTSSRLNDNTNEELDEDLNFDYEPVLTKILDEKKLALSGLPDVVKFLRNLQQHRD